MSKSSKKKTKYQNLPGCPFGLPMTDRDKMADHDKKYVIVLQILTCWKTELAAFTNAYLV